MQFIPAFLIRDVAVMTGRSIVELTKVGPQPIIEDVTDLGEGDALIALEDREGPRSSGPDAQRTPERPAKMCGKIRLTGKQHRDYPGCSAPVEVVARWSRGGREVVARWSRGGRGVVAEWSRSGRGERKS